MTPTMKPLAIRNKRPIGQWITRPHHRRAFAHPLQHVAQAPARTTHCRWTEWPRLPITTNPLTELWWSFSLCSRCLSTKFQSSNNGPFAKVQKPGHEKPETVRCVCFSWFGFRISMNFCAFSGFSKVKISMWKKIQKKLTYLVKPGGDLGVSEKNAILFRQENSVRAKVYPPEN